MYKIETDKKLLYLADVDTLVCHYQLKIAN